MHEPVRDLSLRGLAAEGYLLAVATAKSRRGLARDFERTGLEPLFVASRTVDEAPSKPAPAMLLSLFAELGVGPREALMVGDTAWDLEMAVNAGCPSIGVLSGAHGEEHLAPHRPLACLPALVDLPPWLARPAAFPPVLAAADERERG